MIARRGLALALALACAGCNAITGASGLSLGSAARDTATGDEATSGRGGGAPGGTTSTAAGGAGGGATTTTSGLGGGTTTTTSSSTTSSTSTTTDTDSLDAAAQHCVDTINMHRATQGLAPYQRWTAAEACSNDEAAKDGVSGQAHGAFGSCGEHAQNECPGWPGTPYAILDGCLQMMWDEGPGDFYGGHGHYINMSSTQYSMVACGFAKAPDGSIWAVQNFQ